MRPEPDWVDLAYFRLSADHLIGRTWSLSDGQGKVQVPYIKLLTNKRIAGEQLLYARRWDLSDDELVFLDELGRIALPFSAVCMDQNGRLRFRVAFEDGAAVELREIDPPTAAAEPDVAVVSHGEPTGRRHLVVLRANEQSLHTQWVQDIGDKDRSWDLCLSFYGEDANFPPTGECEYSVLQNKDRKFTAIVKLFGDKSVLWKYDYYIFPDDDLLMSWSDLNLMFEVCREYELDLAQPALHPRGVINYHETRQNRNFLLRYVSMVEIMAPILSREALRVCLPTFNLNKTGFGLDYAWSKLLAGPATKIAIIDKVAILHTRFTGEHYDLAAARQEGLSVAGSFGTSVAYSIKELGGIFLEPLSLSQLRHADLEPELADLRHSLAEADRLKSDWYEPQLAGLAREVARLTDLLAAAGRLKSGWYDPELTRLADEVTRVTTLLAEADRLKSEWYVPELARLADEVGRLTSRLAEVDRPERDRPEAKPKPPKTNAAPL